MKFYKVEKTIKLYEFSELSENIKDIKRESYLSRKNDAEFLIRAYSIIENEFDYVKKMEVDFDFQYNNNKYNYCIFVGDIYIKDFVEKYKENFTNNEIKDINFIINNINNKLKIKADKYKDVRISIYRKGIPYLNQFENEENLIKVTYKILEIIRSEYKKIHDILMKEGYKYFHIADDKEVNRFYEYEGILFDSDGNEYFQTDIICEI